MRREPPSKEKLTKGSEEAPSSAFPLEGMVTRFASDVLHPQPYFDVTE
jgi:hypothetical protein